MKALSYDLRFALRQLLKAPGLTLLAVVTLALGIGANTAIFTVIQNVLLRPLPYAESNRLVYIGSKTGKPGFGSTSWLNYRDIHDEAKLFEYVAGYSNDIGVVETEEGSQSVVTPRVTTNLFSMLGARPLLGRSFTQSEGESGGPQAAILSEGLWRQSYHSDSTILGKTIRVSGIARTVVGVMPASFGFPDEAGPDIHKALWLPLQPTPEMRKGRGYDFFEIVAKTRPGITATQVQQELDAIAARIPAHSDGTRYTFRADNYQELLTGPVRPVLYGLLCALALVLLIACANVSNLLIARCLARRQEFAVRAALGAGRMRLVRQMLAEGTMLSLLGCAAGVALAELAMEAVRKLPEGTIPHGQGMGLHWTVVLVLAVIAVIVTVLSSVLPALLAARANPHAALQQASRGLGAHSAGGKLSRALVAGEVALSTLLLVGTGLLFHTLWNLEQARLGFDSTRVTTFTAMPADSAGFSQMAVSEDTVHAPASVAALVYQPVLEQMRHAPGVEGAALITSPPLSGTGVQSSFEIAGRAKERGKEMQTLVSAVSADYARTMETPVISGRMIGDGDTAASPFVTVVNQAFVRQYFSGENPLGKQITLGGKDTGMIAPYTIVGVLGDQVQDSIGGAVQPSLLLPMQQVPTTSLFYQALLKTMVSFVVKTRGDIPIAAEMRSVFHEAAPSFALDDFETMQQAVDKKTFDKRLGLYLVSSFAGLAVAMVIAGLYGVLSQFVGYRKREIGVRMALGATRGSVAGLVLRQGSILVGAGLAAGLALAFAAGRFVASFLYQVHPADAWTYGGVIAALTTVALLAALLPAHKAASIEPMQALREE